MRDIEYKAKSFRLNEKTYSKLKKLKGDESWNIFFLHLIELKQKHG